MKKSTLTEMLERIIAELPPGQREQCEELAYHFRRQVEVAGNPVGPLAFALVGEELSTAAGDER